MKIMCCAFKKDRTKNAGYPLLFYQKGISGKHYVIDAAKIALIELDNTALNSSSVC